MAKQVFFVEQREDGRYNVTEKGVKTPFAVTPTQARGIDVARSRNPDAAIHVESSASVMSVPAATNGGKFRLFG